MLLLCRRMCFQSGASPPHLYSATTLNPILNFDSLCNKPGSNSYFHSLCAPGVLHLAPYAIATQRVTGPDSFPLAAFLIALEFLVVFFLHRALAPALRLSPQLHSQYITSTPVRRLPASCTLLCMLLTVMRVSTSLRETPGICRSPPLASATSSHVRGLAVF